MPLRFERPTTGIQRIERNSELVFSFLLTLLLEQVIKFMRTFMANSLKLTYQHTLSACPTAAHGQITAHRLTAKLRGSMNIEAFAAMLKHNNGQKKPALVIF